MRGTARFEAATLNTLILNDILTARRYEDMLSFRSPDVPQILPSIMQKLKSVSKVRLVLYGLVVYLLGFTGVVAAGRIMSDNSDVPGYAAKDLTTLETTHYTLAVDVLRSPPDGGHGGAIDAIGEDVFLITRLGGLHLLNKSNSEFEPLALEAPNAVSGEDFYSRQKDQIAIGYKDLKVRPTENDALEFTVSQARVDVSRQCVALYVSQAKASADLKEWVSPWTTVWRSNPCIDSASGSFPMQSGGAMAFLQSGEIAVFVGDFGVDGYNRDTEGVDPQSDDNDYGKVIAIDLETGESRHLSKGHRNPGGLASDANGLLWQAEHGAEGGDEINLIKPGQNYGWPLETYGSHYGLRYWPRDATVATHDAFTAPVYAFVPSVAPGTLAVLDSDMFPNWRGDLLLGTLKDQSLIRLHVRDERVVVAEPIKVGARIRDIAVGGKGEIYLKDDNWGRVFRLSRIDEQMPDLASLEGHLRKLGCATCHNGPNRVAPPVDSVFGRRIAADSSFAYSAALSAKDGVWTKASLRQFLLNPEDFAPGATMPAPDLTEAELQDLLALLAANAEE